MTRSRPGRGIIEDVTGIYYPAAPHGIAATNQDVLNADLLAFLQR